MNTRNVIISLIAVVLFLLAVFVAWRAWEIFMDPVVYIL